ncbi:hypothetical protein [Winogradskyella sp. KYW1333]|uniref:hypothetical protein n=1 Tax=Winogradskyella sp. KYW1333 TaxID=2282123 RepID=UPI000DF15C2B|nr:hypothetical protein [Winogradskyella sp. KYW1333]RCT55475.1 hypothetical protein DUZ96_04090 [Winogradskyella sp. KYW1333]
MKKLAFTFVLLFSFACSKDDNSNSNNQVDPIIGSWQSSFTLTDETEDGEVVNISANGIIIFNADGTGSRNLLITTDGGVPQESNETFEWENLSSALNSSETTQNYSINGDAFTAIFTSNFSSFVLSEDNEDFQISMTRN